MPNIGGWELLLILAVVVLLFGTRKLPELGKGVGSAIRNFKSSMREVERDEIEAAKPPQQVSETSETTRSSSQSSVEHRA